MQILHAAVELRAPRIVELMVDILGPQLTPARKLSVGGFLHLEPWRLPVFRELVHSLRPYPVEQSWTGIERYRYAATYAHTIVAQQRVRMIHTFVGREFGMPARVFCMHMKAAAFLGLTWCPRSSLLQGFEAAAKQGESGD